MDNVMPFTGTTTIDRPADMALREALTKDLDGCFVVGRTKDGQLYFASSICDGGDILWLWELVKAELLNGNARE